MPFQSTAQQKWAFATGQPFAKRWADVTDFSHLPKRVKRLAQRGRLKDVSATPAPGGMAHGPGGLASMPGLGGVKKKAWSPQARAAALAARRRNMLARQGQVLPDADARNLASARREAARLGKVQHTPVAKLPKAGGGKGGKGGKGGGKGKQTPAARAAEREQQQASNREAVNQGLMDADAALGPTGVQAVLDAADGGAIKDGAALAKLGMAEQNPDGSYRLTANARALANAANRGDVRGALDAIGRGNSQADTAAQRDFARQQRRMEQVMRQQAAAQRKADIAARRAKLQQKRGGGGKHSGPASAAEQRAALRFQQSQDDRQARIDRQARLDAEHEADRQLRLQRQQQGGREAPVGKPRNNVVTSGAGTNRAVTRPSAPPPPAPRATAPSAPKPPAASDRSKFDRRRTTKAHAMNQYKAGSPGDYLVVEDPDKPSTWHLQVKRNGTPDHRLMGAAWAALHSGFRGQPYQGPNKDAALSKLRALYAAEKLDVPAQKDASFTVYKDARGQYRWVMLSSNAFRDRDGEIVSTKALGDDVARADQDHTYGPLRWWHMGVPFGPGVDLGTCDFNAMVGKMLIESGTFASPAIGAAIAAKADQLQGSIGFTHPADEPDRDGVFWHIHRFERSLVPRGKAANPFTSLYVQETPMDETKLKALAELLNIPVDQVQGLVASAQTKEAKIEAAGVAFKSEEPAPEPAATKDDGDMAVTENALPPDGEPEGDEGGMEPDGDENMLTMAECQQIAQMTAQAVIEQLMPHLDIGKKMDEVKGMLGGVAGAYAKKDAEQAALKEQLATLTARLKELEGDQPKGGGYRASLDTATVVTKETPAPAADPLNDFIGGFVLGGAQPAAR